MQDKIDARSMVLSGKVEGMVLQPNASETDGIQDTVVNSSTAEIIEPAPEAVSLESDAMASGREGSDANVSSNSSVEGSKEVVQNEGSVDPIVARSVATGAVDADNSSVFNISSVQRAGNEEPKEQKEHVWRKLALKIKGLELNQSLVEVYLKDLNDK